MGPSRPFFAGPPLFLCAILPPSDTQRKFRESFFPSQVSAAVETDASHMPLDQRKGLPPILGPLLTRSQNSAVAAREFTAKPQTSTMEDGSRGFQQLHTTPGLAVFSELLPPGSPRQAPETLQKGPKHKPYLRWKRQQQQRDHFQAPVSESLQRGIICH